jgi:hypothetical protein
MSFKEGGKGIYLIVKTLRRLIWAGFPVLLEGCVVEGAGTWILEHILDNLCEVAEVEPWYGEGGNGIRGLMHLAIRYLDLHANFLPPVLYPAVLPLDELIELGSLRLQIKTL